VADHITNQPVIGMGHSIGGYFTYAAAARYPDLFSKIILLDPIIYSCHIVWTSAVARFLGLSKHHWLPRMTRGKKSEFADRKAALDYYAGKGMFKTWHKAFVESFVDTAIEKDSADSYSLCCHPEFEAQICEALPSDTWAHAKKITVPVMVLRGEKSHLFYRSSLQSLSNRLENSQCKEVENHGHFFVMESPERTIETILPFFQK
jgi:pimeloyl-ACP methyl ester carboxylesterase